MKKIYLTILTLLLGASGMLVAQITIGSNDKPAPGALLDLKNLPDGKSNKALLITRVDSVEVITNPTDGMIAYDISYKAFRIYQNGSWGELTGNVYTSPYAPPSISASSGLQLKKRVPSKAFKGIPFDGYVVLYYQRGNGGGYEAQTLRSTGVTGLVAELHQGTLNNSDGYIRLNVTGTPNAVGNAQFTFLFGGVSYSFTLEVSNLEALPAGSGTLTGKAFFDIAYSNSNHSNSCGLLEARQNNKSDFTKTAVNKQSYTFTPTETVGNVRFYYKNTNGVVITSINGGENSMNITAPVVVTVNFNRNLNTLARGLTKQNALRAELYVVYTVGNVEKKLKLLIDVKDCLGCGANIAPDVWREFLCHDLGADPKADPFTPSYKLIGAYVQWGKRGLNTTGNSVVDWKNTGSNGLLGFAQSWNSTIYGDHSIYSWSETLAPSNAWNEVTELAPIKGAADPCPAGYRVPTATEVRNLKDYNSMYGVGVVDQSQYPYLGLYVIGGMGLPLGNIINSRGALWDRWGWSIGKRATSSTDVPAEIGVAAHAIWVTERDHCPKGCNYIDDIPSRRQAYNVRCIKE